MPPSFKKKKGRDGAVYYCEKRVTLGSRFPKEFCLTEADAKEFFKELTGRKRSMQDDHRQRTGTCVGRCGGM